MNTSSMPTTHLRPAKALECSDHSLPNLFRAVESAEKQYKDQINEWDMPDEARAMLNMLNTKLFEAVRFFMSYGNCYPVEGAMKILPPRIIYRTLLYAQRTIKNLEQCHQRTIEDVNFKDRQRGQELRALAELEGALGEEEERQSREK